MNYVNVQGNIANITLHKPENSFLGKMQFFQKLVFNASHRAGAPFVKRIQSCNRAAEIQEKIEATKQPYSQAVMRLASVEVLEHNKKDLERLLHNERSAREKEQAREQTQQRKRNGQTI